MPLYEYLCRSCGHKFEALVREAIGPKCPRCEGDDLERLLSLFSVNSDNTRQSALADGRRAAKKDERDRLHAEHEDRHHHH